MVSTVKYTKLGIAALVLQVLLTATDAVMPDSPHEVVIGVMSDRSKHILQNATESQLRDLLQGLEYNSPAYDSVLKRIDALKR